MRSRPQRLQSPRYIKKKRKQVLWRSIVIGLGVIAWVVTFMLIMRMQWLQIDRVQVTGNQTVDSTQVQTIAERELDGTWWGIPLSNMFIYPRTTIETSITVSIQRIASVHAIRHGDILDIEVSERLPVAVVCPSPATENCIFADDRATLFSMAPESAMKVYPTFTYATPSIVTTASTSIGATFTDPEQMNTLIELASNVTKAGFPIHTIMFMPDDVITLSSNTASSTLIYLRRADRYEAPFQNLLLFIDKMNSVARAKHEQVSYSLIDLRYGNNIVYKAATSTR